MYIWVGQPFNQIRQAQLAYGCELVSKRFSFLSLKRDEDFARIKSIDFAGQRNNLNAIQILVGLIIADDNSWPGLTNLAADRRIKTNPSPRFISYVSNGRFGPFKRF